MAAKSHIDSIWIGPIAINLTRHIAYYFNELNHSIIIDYASLCKILCHCSVLLAAILKNVCQDSQRQYFDWPHSYKFA